MSHCQRCGATNEPTSRFCVACGAPLVTRSSPVAAPPPTAPPPAPGPSLPAVPSTPGGHAAVIHPYEGSPPSSSLQFAETASPPTREEFEAYQAAAAAAVARAAELAPSGPPPGYAAQPAPIGSYAPGALPATAAMPGVPQDPELLPEGTPRILAGFFISYETQPHGRFWPVYQGKNRIGRQGAAPDLDIELDHPTASSRHALVLAAACPGRIKVEDTGSTNGTLVNGTRLTAGVRHELRDGDRVRFGLLTTIVKII